MAVPSPILEVTTLNRTARILAFIVMGIALLVLGGWTLGIERLMAVLPGWAVMKANSAVCFVLSGLSLLMLTRREADKGAQARGVVVFIAAGLILLMGSATLLEYILRIDLHIDQLFFRDVIRAGSDYYPGRISPVSATNFCCVACAFLLLAGNRSRILVQLCTAIAAFLTLVVLTGTSYGVESLLASGHSTAVAVHTSLCFCLVYAGIFCVSGTEGVMRLVVDRGAAGMIVRRLLPTAILLPMAISWICAFLERSGFFGMELGISIFSISTIVLFTALVWRSAEFLHLSEKDVVEAQEKVGLAQQRYNFLAEAMPQIVWTAKANGDVDYFNQSWFTYTGLTYEQSMKWAWQPVVHPDDLQNCLDHWNTSLATGCEYEVEYRFKRASDGTYRWQLGRAYPLRDEQGKILQWVGTCTDIEDQKRARVVLEKRVGERTSEVFSAQRRLQAVLDAATHVSIIATTPEGVITLFNHGAELLLGYSADEMIGKETPARYRLAAEVDVYGRELTQELGRPVEGFDILTIKARLGQPEAREWTFLRKDGSTITVSQVVTASYDAKGEVAGFLGIAMDVSARKHAEKQLRDQALILDLANDTIFVRDTENRIIYWNQGAQRLYGWSREEAMGRVTHALLKTDFPQPLEQIMEQLNSNGHWEGELVHRRRDGSLVTVASSWTLQRDETGQALSVIEMNYDITARKKAEQELEESRARLNAILFGSLDGVIVYESVRDHAGVLQDFRFSMINPAAEKMMQTPAKEILGRTMLGKFPHVRTDGLFKKFSQIVESGFTLDFEYESKRTLSARWYRIAGVKLGDGLVISYTEITTRKENERKLKDAKEHAELADRAKSDFLANMSHEIRTPMNGVIGMTSLLLDTRLDAEQRGLSETIRSSAESLLGLINDILDFSKIEAGKLSFEEIDFDLRKIVEDTLEMMAGAAQAKGIELVGGIEPGMPSQLRGDPGRVQQVLTNLVSNAIKFTSQGEVSVRVLPEQETDSSVKVRFEIKDSGIGISPEGAARLFQPFVQADNSTSRKFGGTGLGLAICKRLAETMRGEIGVNSTPGQGSTFWVTMNFPRLAAVSNAAFTSDFADARVLVVENNLTSRHYLHQQMVAWRLKDGCASTALEALEMLRRGVEEKSPYTLAIIDAQLPEVDGLELIRRINADPALGPTRLVLLMPFGKSISSAELSSVRIAGSCAKPVRQSMLFDCMAHALNARGSTGAVCRPGESVRAAQSVSARSERILLAEDNVVNQQVALGNLRKLGFAADVAANGLEVLEAMETKRFDVILMDCQMPDLDGYDVTREIRRREKSGHRTWIIAMTANAMVGDREKCLAAGMDDYVSKPLRRSELRSALERAVVRSETPSVDEKFLQAMKEDDEEGLVLLIGLFSDSAPSSIVDMRKALGNKNAPGLAMAAHTLKGSCSNLGATCLRETCARLETSARTGEISDAAAAIDLIERELRRTIDALGSFRKTHLTS